MTDRDELLQSILDSDSSADYPAEFQEKYVLMECLSEQKGITTFLVQDPEGKNHNAMSAICGRSPITAVCWTGWIIKAFQSIRNRLRTKTCSSQSGNI